MTTTAKTALTSHARTLLGDAIRENKRHILDNRRPNLAATTELRDRGLITLTRSLTFPTTQSWELTEAGMAMRAVVLRDRENAQLVNLMNSEMVDSEDLADIAASVDARETDYIGRGQDGFVLMFALTASVRKCSAAELREELETHLGWNY